MAKNPYFCDECGTRNTPDSKYCKECGAQIHVAYQTLALSDYDRIDDPTEQERLTQFLDMAFWHNEAGNLDAAVRACNAALALNPNSTTALSLLGSLYEKQGDDALAIAQFEHVLALNPDSEADRFKLLQLQEGIHAKPLQASPVYRWLPPALGTARFSTLAQAWRDWRAGLRRPEMTLLPARATPALAAGAAAILVLAAGLFLVKPSSPGRQVGTTVVVRPAARSAFGAATAQAPGNSPLPPPVLVLPAHPGTPLMPPPTAVASVPPRDPFAGAVPEPLTYQPLSGGAHRAGAGQMRGVGGSLRPLPPLVAVPSANAGPLPPASVSLPPSLEANAPISPDSDMARHTVVVSHLGGLSEFAPSNAVAPTSGGYSTDQDTSQGPPPRIQITVDPSTDSGSSAGSNSNSQAGAEAGGSGSAGESAQQAAFALQQQGNYRQAAASYEQAIRAYQAQIASGEDRDAAERGLQACQTGLQICRQNS